VWTANRRGYDARTGELVRELKQDVIGPMIHDRCYRNRITARWYINSVTGGSDYLALDGSGEFPNHWARSTCGVGLLPCNGLLYLGPHACACYNTVALTAFNALASEPGLKSSGQPIPLKIEPRLAKGPAFADSGGIEQPAGPGSWPTYRNDISRGGSTKAAVSAKLEPKWQAKLGPKISAPTVAEGKVFVANVDAHSVSALDAEGGKLLWTYTTGGRVDSPPTWHEGRLLFGSHDGWVYCLHARDGKLAWRFKGLPDRSICAYKQVESAWPVNGSILVRDNTAYFCAGRNSFVDGGMVLFGLDPQTGQVRYRRHLYGPYKEDGSQVFMTRAEYAHPFGIRGNKADILLADDKYVYLRHEAFTPDLRPIGIARLKKPHLITVPGFVQPIPHHRSFWTINTRLLYDLPTGDGPSQGDILVKDGNRFYEVRGYQPSRHSYFDPRTAGYTLFAGEIVPKEAPARKEAPGRRRKKAPLAGVHQTVKERWKADIPLTGKAMALAGGVLFVAGTPVTFPKVRRLEVIDVGKRFPHPRTVLQGEGPQRIAACQIHGPIGEHEREGCTGLLTGRVAVAQNLLLGVLCEPRSLFRRHSPPLPAGLSVDTCQRVLECIDRVGPANRKRRTLVAHCPAALQLPELLAGPGVDRHNGIRRIGGLPNQRAIGLLTESTGNEGCGEPSAILGNGAEPGTPPGSIDSESVVGIPLDHVQDAVAVNEFLGLLCAFESSQDLSRRRIEHGDGRIETRRAVDFVPDGRQLPLKLSRGVFDVDVHRLPVGKRMPPQFDTAEGVAADQREPARQSRMLDGCAVLDAVEPALRRDQTGHRRQAQVRPLPLRSGYPPEVPRRADHTV